jgi:DUF4097 and DUF4098 domain-containing protein YvlB
MIEMSKGATAVVAALVFSTAARAQDVQERRAADAKGRVYVENHAGTVNVVGWERNEVEVTGTLGEGAEGIEIQGEKGSTSVSVDTAGNPHGVHSRLEVKVPRGSTVEIEGFATRITVNDVVGGVQAETVNGSIAVHGAPREVDLESVNGGVTVDGPALIVRASSVNGPVTVRGAREEVEASTVNGPLEVAASGVQRAHLESVSGSLVFEGSLAVNGSLDVETVSGGADLIFPGGLNGHVSVSSFSGEIENDFGPDARRRGRHVQRSELSFTAGEGKGSISVSTLSGLVRLRRQR